MEQEKLLHKPVMCNEIVKYLDLKQGQTLLDCTVGCAGHADALLKQLGPKGRLIGIDQDNQALELARARLQGFSNFVLIQGNFKHLNEILAKLRVKEVDGIIFDLGLSSLQLENGQRGFSIKFDTPLDMRMDRNLKLSAFDLVNFLPEVSLAGILKNYGQERWHNRIASAIVRERKRSLVLTTGQLAEIVKRAAPYSNSRIHPATRTFQALRIAVNDELEALRTGLNKSIDFLKAGGKICVICFHSLEDRIVKHQFRAFAKEGKLRLITKKPLTPSRKEVIENPRSRSAKLRVAERI